MTRTCPNQGGRHWYDAYLKEYQQISSDDLRYPWLALAGIRNLIADQVNARIGRYTFLGEGIWANSITSATLVGAAAYTRNPAELMLAMLYNRRWGLGNETDSYVECTVTNTAGNYTVGEKVTGPANAYQFKGEVISWDGTTRALVVESLQGLPHGAILGGTSGKTATVSSIDECYGCELSSFYAFKTFCDEYVPDASGVDTTVNGNSAATTDMLFVTATTGFAVGDKICIDFEGTRPEVKEVLLVLAGPARLQLTTNLAYTHTAVQADTVKRAEKRALFDYYWDGGENGMDALNRIAKCSRALILRSSLNKIRVVPLQSDTPEQLVSMGNIKVIEQGGGKVVDPFKIEYQETGVRPNRITVHYLDAAMDYRKMPAMVEDPQALTDGEKIVPAELELYGITRSSQAHREAWWRLQKLRYEGDPIQFLMGPDHINFQAGDRFRLQSDLGGKGTAGGRVHSSTNDTLDLDHPATIAGGEAIRVRLQDDTQDASVITSGAGTHKQVSINPDAWAVNPSAGDIYAIGTLPIYRAVSVKFNQDLQAEIQAIYDPDTLYNEDFGDTPSYTPTTLPDPDELPPDVENLTLSEGSYRNQARGIVNFIEVHWTRPEHPAFFHAEIWMRELTEERITAGATDWATGTGNREFDHPRGVCTDGTYIYIADTFNNRVFKFAKRDLAYSLKVGSLGSGNDNFSHPYDLCTDGTYLYVLDTHNHRINVRLCADLTHHGNFGAVGAGNGQFSFPHGICIDTAGNLYVTDSFNHRVQKFTTALGVPAYATKIGTQGAGVDQFERPMGIDHPGAVGNLLIADTGNDRLAKLDDGLLGNAGAGTWATYGSTGTGDNNFNAPIDVALKADWSYYWVCDLMNHRVHRRIGSDNSLDLMHGGLTAGTGRDEYSGPRGICHVAADSLICLAEFQNHRVQLRDDGTVDFEDWQIMGTSPGCGYRITQGVGHGEGYLVAVVSVSPHDGKKSPTDSPSEAITPTGIGGAPSDVANIYAANHGMGIRLWWDAVVCVDLAGYEIRAGNDWATGRVLALRHTATELILAAPPITGSSVTYRIKAVSTSSQYSATAATVVHTAASALISRNLPVTHSVNLRTS